VRAGTYASSVAESHPITLNIPQETNMETMANYRIGRVALHLMCILRGGDHRMHLAGVMRELRPDRC